MADESDFDPFGLLVPLAGKVWEGLSVLHAERTAGQSPFIADIDFFAGTFDETLGRLSAIQQHDEWWRRLLGHLAARYVKPELFMRPALQDWLANNSVTDDLKVLAVGRITDAKEVDHKAHDRLIDSYGLATGEASHLARSAIDIVVAMLVAAAFARLDEGARVQTGILPTGRFGPLNVVI